MKLSKLKVGIIGAFCALLGIGATAMALSTPVPNGGTEIESDLGVLNTTKNEQTYQKSTNANFDEVVNVWVWVHDKEQVGSGKDANNVVLKVDMPSTPAKTHVLKSTVGGSNSNTVTETASVVSTETSTLAYIPGSSIRTYNAGTNANPNWITTKIDDSVVGAGYNVGTVHPCCKQQESIVFQARILVPTISIEKEVKISGVGTWQKDIEARPGDTINYLITVKNAGNTRLTDVIVRDSMPPKFQYIAGSATMTDSNYPNGTPIPDSIAQMGVNVGNFAPGGLTYVRLQAKIPADQTACNLTHTNVAHAKNDSVGDWLNTARVKVICETARDARVKITKFNDLNGNKTQDAGESNLAGWQFRVTGPSYDQTFTTDSTGNILVTSLAAGHYTVTEINKTGWINTTGLTLAKDIALGETGEYRFGNQQVTPPPACVGDQCVQTLPSSGPTETAAMVFGSLIATGGSLSYIRSRKGLKKAILKR